jgi:argininosuccinate lyase
MADRQNDSNKSSSIWGGRFSEGPSKIMERINTSIDFDKKMYSQDIRASKAHTSMLINQKIITKNDGEKNYSRVKSNL